VRKFIGPLILGLCLTIPLTPALAGARAPKTAKPPTTTPTPPTTTTPVVSTTSTTRKPSSNQTNSSKNNKVTTQIVTPPPACGASLGSFSPAASACYGFVSGNVLDSSSTDVAVQTAALASLGLTFTNFNDYLKITPGNPSFLDFGQPLYGDTVIGIHFGNGSGVGNSTGFFTFNFLSSVNGITLNIHAVSDVVLYKTTTVPTTAVPEPATWAMMLLGFGAIGFAARRRRKGRQLQARPA
jgi:hypothetical protein